jgi:hypothetical protein
MKAGQDIHVKWTATSGTVSKSHHPQIGFALTSIGLVVYLQRLECIAVECKWIDVGIVEEYGSEICSSFLDSLQLCACCNLQVDCNLIAS